MLASEKNKTTKFKMNEINSIILNFLRGFVCLKINEKFFINSKGLLNGKLKVWYNNGKIKRENNYNSGKLHNVCKWFSKGNSIVYTFYNNGERVNPYKEIIN